MNDDDWVHIGRGKWRYYPRDPERWSYDEALIGCAGPTDWRLIINRNHIGTFNSWGEARDATPMMISLHGYKGNAT